MLNFFRAFIFAFGLGVIILALFLVHGDGECSREFIFTCISIIVMYVMVMAPFTFFSILPKTENVEKAIATYTASWFAITAYCASSIALLIFVISRNIVIGWFMGLPKDWIEKVVGENSEIMQQAAHYSDLIFYAVVVIQLILFFAFMVKMFFGCLVAHQIGSVKQRETQEFSRIAQLRSQSQLLEVECAANASIPAEQKNAIAKIKNDLRYLSPANSAEAFDYEAQMVESLSALRSLCKQGGASADEIQNAINAFAGLLQARKLIYKN